MLRTSLFLLLAFGFQLFPFTPLSAQTPAPGATPARCPAGPLVKPLPDFVRWKVTSQEGPGTAAAQQGAPQGGDSQQPAPVPSKTVITGERIGKTAHIISTTEGNGSSTETWTSDGLQVVMAKGWEKPAIGPAAPYTLPGNFGWISPASFVGIVKVNGRDCMIFQKDGADACVDLESRMPMILKSPVKLSDQIVGIVSITYEFAKIPSGETLSIPRETKAIFDQHAQEQSQQAKAMDRP